MVDFLALDGFVANLILVEFGIQLDKWLRKRVVPEWVFGTLRRDEESTVACL